MQASCTALLRGTLLNNTISPCKFADFSPMRSTDRLIAFRPLRLLHFRRSILMFVIAVNLCIGCGTQDARPLNVVLQPGVNLGIDAVEYFSSAARWQDGRIKPDIVAPGSMVLSVKSGSSVSLDATSE